MSLYALFPSGQLSNNLFNARSAKNCLLVDFDKQRALYFMVSGKEASFKLQITVKAATIAKLLLLLPLEFNSIHFYTVLPYLWEDTREHYVRERQDVTVNWRTVR